MELSFDLTDFDKYQCLEIINEKNYKECNEYSIMFQNKLKEYQKYNDNLGIEIFDFLSKVTSLSLGYELALNQSKLEGYYLNSLSHNNILILKELINQVINPEIKARFAHILWIYRIDTGNMGKQAIESYLQSARNIEETDKNNLFICSDRLTKAAKLATIIDGKKTSVMQKKVVDYIDDLINRYISIKDEFFTGSAMQILQKELLKSLADLKKDDLSNYINKYANIAFQKATCENSLPDYHHAIYNKIAYHEIERDWYKILKNKEGERNATIALAEIDVWYAQKRIQNEVKPYGVASSLIGNAIRKYQKIEDKFGKKQDTSERIEYLHKQMLDYQQIMMKSEMLSIEVYLGDGSSLQQQAKQLVMNKSLGDALSALSQESMIPDLDYLKKTAQQSIELDNLGDLFPTSYVDKEGKTKAIQNNGETRLQNKMFRIAKVYQEDSAINFILPACDQICSEHNIKLEDLEFLVKDNLFIPKGREFIYAQGLLAGFYKNFIISSHLLIPQLENSLRHILQVKGFITSKLTPKMIQDEYSLNQVFDKHYDNLVEIFNEDIVFNLKGLLIERMGSNLRNEICHGLYDDQQFYTGLTPYLFWVTLHLCFIFKMESE